MTHRGLLHHQIITVSSVARSGPFYAGVLGNLGYELAGSAAHFQDWKRWDLATPHEFSIVEPTGKRQSAAYAKGAVGHHHHIAFCALSRRDVDSFYRDVLLPLQASQHTQIEDPPCDCPEYGEGYYATFFADPDGLKFEFVFNPNHAPKRRLRARRPHMT